MGSRTVQREKQVISQTQRDIIFFKERDAERAANAAKSERLRTLRLAKEAQDRAAAEAAAAEKAARPKAKPRVKSSAG